MRLTVWKFVMPRLTGETEVMMPRGAQTLCAREQHNGIAVWARVDPSAPKVARKFALCMTGSEAPGTTYVGTASLDDGAFVVHVFEVGR